VVGPHGPLGPAYHGVLRRGEGAGNLWRRSSFKNHPRSRGWRTGRRSRLS